MLAPALAAVLLSASAAPKPEPKSAPKAAPASAAADPFAAWEPLLGDWMGEGSGQPGEATGGFSFERDLQGRVLVRRSHADYPASKERPAFRHEDLTVIALEGGAPSASYFDNEGHVIRYRVTHSPETHRTVFLSDAIPGAPRFRLTYDWTAPERLTLTFEIAPPGAPEQFKTYLSARAHRAPAKR
ncbi:hypothetical protein FGE12_06065 [Aggregicoccus sp. 17bor-14]|uniref:hypothetical protein n=1 Tax=Myxococcaceae TaxID=31 RepID=UPI00129C3602|nr:MULTISPECIES: hypothetical protein [Myxococcaceae]MBF5041950.1 hypothetical protein [Simulacricoccus sp. 17bor-14]MRI87731.1 hypothetical protein [Aggregicoccus sp. 17bor-14]